MTPLMLDRLLRDRNPDYHWVAAYGKCWLQSTNTHQTVNVNTINSLPKLWHDNQNANIEKNNNTCTPNLHFTSWNKYTCMFKVQTHTAARSYHNDYFWVYRFGENAASRRDVIDELVETSTLDFFAFQIRDRIHKIEHHTTLLQFLYEQFLLLLRRCICQSKQFCSEL